MQAGAILRDDLSHANVILGVKEVPMKDLLPGKTYMFFSHTHKGQSYNMPMLKDILDKVNLQLYRQDLNADLDNRARRKSDSSTMSCSRMSINSDSFSSVDLLAMQVCMC